MPILLLLLLGVGIAVAQSRKAGGDGTKPGEVPGGKPPGDSGGVPGGIAGFGCPTTGDLGVGGLPTSPVDYRTLVQTAITNPLAPPAALDALADQLVGCKQFKAAATVRERSAALKKGLPLGPSDPGIFETPGGLGGILGGLIPGLPVDPYGILTALGATPGIESLPVAQRKSVQSAIAHATDPEALRKLATALQSTGQYDAAADVKRAADLLEAAIGGVAAASTWPGVRMLPDPQKTFALNTLLYKLNYAALYDPTQRFCERMVPSTVPDWASITTAPAYPSPSFDHWFSQYFMTPVQGFPPAPDYPSAEWDAWFAANVASADVSKVPTKDGPPIVDPECALSLPVRIRDFVAGLASLPVPGALPATMELNAVADRLEGKA